MNFIVAKTDNLPELIIMHQPLRLYNFPEKNDEENPNEFIPTFSFLATNYVFLVSRYAPYSYLEKALMPFDSEIWYWLIGFMVVGLLVIIVVSFMSNTVQNFVFGLNVRAPMLNLV
jgi:hypothetical protein